MQAMQPVPGSGGAAAPLPCAAEGRAAEAERQFRFLLRFFTPRTVFMDVGSPDGELARLAGTYVERVWCVDPAVPPHGRVPCNVRTLTGGPARLAPDSIDVAFSREPNEILATHRALAPNGILVFWNPARVELRRRLMAAGFSRISVLPFVLARWGAALPIVARKSPCASTT